MIHPIGTTPGGVLVYVDLIHSAAGGQVSRQPHLLGLAAEVLKKTNLKGKRVVMEYDMKRSIGYDYVVSTNDTDVIFYAQLLRDDIYTRFVKNGKPEPANHLALVLERDQDGGYQLLDAWIGHLTPPRPGSVDETTESKAYWQSHAFVMDDQPIQLRSRTMVCPY